MAPAPPLEPNDEHNQRLAELLRPAAWTNPTPTQRYNLVAIGGGAGGIISALATAGLGGAAALVERQWLGGDCLNFGCVPSKALLRAARAAWYARQGSPFGIQSAEPIEVCFGDVMRRLRRVRAEIGQHDAAERFRSLGVDVFLGDARFVGPDSIEVEGQHLMFHRAVIATGSRPARLELPGLDDTEYLTNETVFSLTELPQRLIVIGAGPVGCELAQAFCRLGSEVHLVSRGERLLSKEDPAAAQLVQRRFEQEGVHLHLGWKLLRAERTGSAKSLVIQRAGQQVKLLADALLVAVGRQPNVEDLGLDLAGVRATPAGILVNDWLQTDNRAIYAAGDVAAVGQRFTHAADAMARLCVRNALFMGRGRFSRLAIPRCTYTDPEVAHVGLTPHAARDLGIEIDSYRVDFTEVDRAVLDGESEGFAVVHTRQGTGRVVGGTIVAAQAGEMIGELTLLLQRRLSLATLAEVVHCYPTQVEALRRVADKFNRTRLKPTVAGLLRRWLAWRRR